jgi:hypothetical protein
MFLSAISACSLGQRQIPVEERSIHLRFFEPNPDRTGPIRADAEPGLDHGSYSRLSSGHSLARVFECRWLRIMSPTKMLVAVNASRSLLTLKFRSPMTETELLFRKCIRRNRDAYCTATTSRQLECGTQDGSKRSKRIEG